LTEKVQWHNVCARVVKLTGRFDEHPSRTYAAQQSVTEFIAVTVMNLFTLKSAARDELLFNKSTFRVIFFSSLAIPDMLIYMWEGA